MSRMPANTPFLPSSVVPVFIVQESLKFVLLGTVLSSFLIPVAIMLFVFSTPRLRRQPAFILNVLAILFGLIQGVLNLIDATRPMLNKPDIPIGLSTFGTSLYILVPLCVESVLIWRVVSVYPPRLLSRARCLAIYGTIVLIKAARIVNAGYLIHLLVSEGPRRPNALQLEVLVWHMPNSKLEVALQLFDDTFISGIFLLRIYAGTRSIVARQPSMLVRAGGPSSYLRRIKTLFWIAVTNFVFPVILNLTLLALILRDTAFDSAMIVLMVNNYFTIIGVLLATIWATGSELDERASARWMRMTAREKAARSSSAPPSGVTYQICQEGKEGVLSAIA